MSCFFYAVCAMPSCICSAEFLMISIILQHNFSSSHHLESISIKWYNIIMKYNIIMNEVFLNTRGDSMLVHILAYLLRHLCDFFSEFSSLQFLYLPYRRHPVMR